MWGFFYSSVGKESACSAGDPGLIPGSGRSPGEGNGNPLQCSCLCPMDRGAWQATAHWVTGDTLNHPIIKCHFRLSTSLNSGLTHDSYDTGKP